MGAVLQCALYAALAWFLATSAPTVAVGSELAGTTYKVVTTDGEVHLLTIDSPDPSRVLVEANARFEHVASTQRLDPAEAELERSKQRRTHVWVLGLCAFPVSFLLVAARRRMRERAFEEVFAVVAPTLSVDIGALTRQTGLPEDRLRREVERIRSRGLADLRWDEEHMRVYDARLSDHTLVLDHCPHCTDPIHVRVRADLTNIPRCPNCMTTFDDSVLARMSQDLTERLLADSTAHATSAAFPLGAFLLWTVVFPPVALLMALRAPD